MTCSWCARPLPPSRGQVGRRFCGDRCRNGYHSAARRYTQAMIDAGLLSADMLRAWDASQKPCTAPTGAGEGR